MHKVTSVVSILAFACALVIGCQSTGKPNQSQPSASSPAAAAPSSQSASQSTQLAQPVAPNPADTAVRAVSAVYTRNVAPAVSTQLNRMVKSPQLGNFVRKVDAFLVDRVHAIGKIRVKLFGVDLQTTELMAIALAAVIILGGGAWTLASRRVARR